MQGVLNAVSVGVLIYSASVVLLAGAFFWTCRIKQHFKLRRMIVCMLLAMGIMPLFGAWA